MIVENWPSAAVLIVAILVVGIVALTLIAMHKR